MACESRDHVVLIVEDDTSTQIAIQNVVESEGAATLIASSVGEAREAISAHPPDLVILDVNLPDELGFALAKEIRDAQTAGIIMLTVRDSDGDRLLGLELGADEYLTKPFNPRELSIRVRNMLMRIDTWTHGKADSSQVVVFGDWQFHPTRRLLTDSAGQCRNLTRLETDILFALVARPSHVFRREELADHFQKGADNPSLRAVDNIIMRLRRKLGETVKEGGHIVTVSGQGYNFKMSPDRADTAQ